jgi:hypothetical protein
LTDANHDDAVVVGCAIAGAGDVRDAALRAMAGRARVDALVVDASPAEVRDLERWLAPDASLGVVEGHQVWGAAEATRSGIMCAVAVAHLAQGNAKTVLIVAARGSSSVAVLLERGGLR